jgi:hypothetical protein
LALFALAVQIVLSFGHAHLDGLSPARVGPAAVANGGAALPGAPNDKSDGTADRYCPVCALIQLAASSLPAVPPALPLPANLDLIALPAPTDISSAPLLHFLFQARAPPSI